MRLFRALKKADEHAVWDLGDEDLAHVERLAHWLSAETQIDGKPLSPREQEAVDFGLQSGRELRRRRKARAEAKGNQSAPARR